VFVVTAGLLLAIATFTRPLGRPRPRRDDRTPPEQASPGAVR